MEATALIILQTQQCRQASIPFHSGRANTLRTDRMPEAAGFPTVRGQAVGLLGDHAAPGREPRSTHSGYEFVEKVGSYDGYRKGLR